MVTLIENVSKYNNVYLIVRECPDCSYIVFLGSCKSSELITKPISLSLCIKYLFNAYSVQHAVLLSKTVLYQAFHFIIKLPSVA